MQPGAAQRDSLIAGRYRLGAALGRGGMAVVHEAHDQRLDRPVAVKLLLPEMAAKPEVRSRFEAEARSAARLAHPNVVAVYDTGEDEGTPFIVMELLPGETLADRIATGRVEEAWLRRVAGDVLQALGAAHAAGIVHRDVKPGNILLGRDGCAKVADFGIAKSAEVAAGAAVALDLTGTNQLVGTPAYVAPERVQGQPATPRADIYALGVVLYEALTGTKPFAGTTPVAIAHAAQQGEYRPLRELRPDVDPTFAAAIERAMARDPDHRFASAAEMLAGLDGTPLDSTQVIAADATLAATRIGTRPHVPPPAERVAPPERRTPALPPTSRRWAPVIVIAGLLLLGLVVLLVATGGGSGGGPSDSPPTGEVRSPLAQQLLAVAERLSVGDGEGGREVAEGLRGIAGTVEEGGSAGDEATDLLARVRELRSRGELGVTAAQAAEGVLLQVPGVDANAGAATAPPAPVAEGGDDDDRGGKGRGKGKGGKDD